MRTVNYKKPAMHFVNLRNEQAVAGDNPCLGAAAGTDGGVFYYDITGNGWIKILTEPNCNGTIIDMDYEPKDATLPMPDQATIDAAKEAARISMATKKQEFSGAMAWAPDTSWS